MSKPFKSGPKSSARPRRSGRRLRLEALEERDVPALFPASTPVLLPPGANLPFGVAVGDFNGDGRPDLATANYGGNVTVLLNDGSGGFLPGSNFAAGDYPQSVAVGDFNGDGKPDLAVANTYGNDVTVLLNNGTGGFLPGSNFAAGNGPRSVAVGDFNGDGKPDLATANQSSNDVTVLLGNGDGTFNLPGSNFAVGTHPQGVAVGDFNGDGRQDLATANWVSYDVTVLLGNGSGGFLPGSNFAAGVVPVGVAVGDFNGDGRQDLAVANYGGNTVSVLLGDGSGGFAQAPGSPIASGNGPRSVAVGDFNGDGRPDLATANYGGNTVSVLLGDGSGGFAPTPGSPLVGTGPNSVAVGDFNGDGLPDLVTANQGSNSVSVLLNRGATATAVAASANPIQAGSPATLTATGSNPPGGGTPDGTVAFFDGTASLGSAALVNGVAVLTVSGLSAGTHQITARYGGSAGFVASTSAPLALQVAPATTTTAVAASSNPAQAGSPVTLTAAVTSPPGGGTPDGSVAFFDGTAALGSAALVNGVASLTVSGLSAGTHQITARYGGSAGFAGSTSAPLALEVAPAPPAQAPRTVAVSGSADGAAQTYAFDSSGSLQPEGAAFTPFAGFGGDVRAAAGDIDGDGTPDTVYGVGPGGGSQIRVRTSTGIDVSATVFEPSFTGGVFVAAGDIDGDGKAEVVVSPDVGGGGRVVVFRLEGNQLVRIADFFGIDDPSFRGGARVAVGDVNGDGTPDVVVAAGFGGGPRVAIFDGKSVLANGAGPGKLLGDFFVFEQALRNGVFVASGDFNGDGKSDLAFGGGPGGGPRVMILDAARVIGGDVAGAIQGPLANFFAGDTSQRGGIRVAAKDIDGDNLADLVTGSGEGFPAHVRTYTGKAVQATGGQGEPALLQDLPAFGGAVSAAGVFVG